MCGMWFQWLVAMDGWMVVVCFATITWWLVAHFTWWCSLFNRSVSVRCMTHTMMVADDVALLPGMSNRDDYRGIGELRWSINVNWRINVWLESDIKCEKMANGQFCSGCLSIWWVELLPARPIFIHVMLCYVTVSWLTVCRKTPVIVRFNLHNFPRFHSLALSDCIETRFVSSN